MRRLGIAFGLLCLFCLAAVGDEPQRPWIQLRPPNEVSRGSERLQPWNDLRLEASIHYGDSLRTTVETRETVEFLVYERRGDKRLRLKRTEVALVPSKPGGHWAWCEIDPPVGGWPASGILIEARLRGMPQVRDRQEVRFEAQSEAGQQFLKSVEESRLEDVPPESGVVIRVGDDRSARVPAGARFLIEGFTNVPFPEASRSRPVEVQLLGSTGPGLQTEQLKQAGLFIHANAFPTPWPAGQNRSWYQTRLRAPLEPGEYRLRIEIESAEGAEVVAELPLTVEKPAKE
jgi:hypothetical protein